MHVSAVYHTAALYVRLVIAYTKDFTVPSASVYIVYLVCTAGRYPVVAISDEAFIPNDGVYRCDVGSSNIR